MDKLDEIPVLPLPEPSWNYRDNISALCFSQQGEENRQRNRPCQDRCGLRVLKARPIFIAAVADGIEACILGDYGAEVAVHSVLDFLEENLEEQASKTGFRLKDKNMAPLLEEAMQHAYDSVKEAAEKAGQLVSAMQSTLTFAVYDGNTLYFAHAGDGGIVVLYNNKEYELVTARHKKEKNAYPLQNTDIWEWGVSQEVAAFALATGGVLNTFVRGENENNRVYFPFLVPAFFASENSKEDVHRTCQEWYGYMLTEKYRSRTAEDLSFAVIVNQKTVQYIGQPEFDNEKWKRQTKMYKEKRAHASEAEKENTEETPLPKKKTAPLIQKEAEVEEELDEKQQDEKEEEKEVQEQPKERGREGKIKKKQSSSSIVQAVQKLFAKIRRLLQGDGEDWDDDFDEDDDFEDEELDKKAKVKKQKKQETKRRSESDTNKQMDLEFRLNQETGNMEVLI